MEFQVDNNTKSSVNNKLWRVWSNDHSKIGTLNHFANCDLLHKIKEKWQQSQKKKEIILINKNFTKFIKCATHKKYNQSNFSSVPHKNRWTLWTTEYN